MQKNIRYYKEEEDAFHHVQSLPNKNTPETANENVMVAMQISEMGNQLESSPNLEDDIINAEISETDLQGFDTGVNLDWSKNFDSAAANHLNEYTTAFYNEEPTHHVEMFDDDVYCPENAKGFAQCLILSLVLHKMKESISKSESTLKNINMYVQGNPGTGKTFVIKTAMNMIKSNFNDQGKAQSVAPTGCAASLSGGQTLHRSVSLPTKSKDLRG